MALIKVFNDMDEVRMKLKQDRPQLLIVHGKRICLVLHSDQLLAVEDRCTHNAESLSKGSMNYVGEVVCPGHGYRFNIKTGRESEERSRDLITYPMIQNDEGIFINL